MTGALTLHSPVVFFTGAGISVGAGLPTYRGSAGLYTSTAVEPPTAHDVTPERLPALWQRFKPRIMSPVELAPSSAHRAIAALERGGAAVSVVTQNVDGLHTQAGSTAVMELHGSLRNVRCMAANHRSTFAATNWDGNDCPKCPACQAPVRPDVVLFGEALDPHTWAEAEASIRQAATIVAVGTSGLVRPAVGLIRDAVNPGAIRIWVNPETPPPSASWEWVQVDADDAAGLLVAPTPHSRQTGHHALDGDRA